MTELELVTRKHPRYPYQRDYGPRWMDKEGNHVGCHPGTTKPLGAPANALTRQARMDAHAVFDKLWKGESRIMSRRAAYRRLAKHLGREVHIGQSDIEQCHEIIAWAKAQMQENDDDNQD